MEKKTTEKWIKGFVLFGFALYILLCLVSFSPYDPSFAFTRTAVPLNDTIVNFGGKIGAYFSSLLIFSLGHASYLLIFILLFLGINAVWGEKTGFLKKLLSSSGIVFSLSVFFALQNGRNFSGGFVGFISAPYLQEYFGENGVFLILLLITAGAVGAGHKIFVSPFKLLMENRISSGKEELPIEEEPPSEQTEQTRNGNLTRKRRKITPKAPARTLIKRKPESAKKEKPEEFKIARPSTKSKDYKLPPLSLLKAGNPIQHETTEDLELYAQVIEETLIEFGIDGEVVQLNQGPRVTMYEVQLAPGVPLQKVYKIQDNLAMNLKTTTVRVVAPLANKSTVGIEVPNRDISMVYLREMLASREFQKSPSKLTISIGKNIMGKSVINDLKNMPHILIAGATGSGKTVCLNSFIASILYKATPEEVKFIMIDPKMVELISYNDLPHLLCPVVVETRQAINTLKWLIAEMARRYHLFSEVKARNIEGYNSISKKEHMPYIVVVIDELADLMMIARNEIENSIIRLAQLSRAAGIHLILATQRPSVNVITGVIKANLPCRISFQVTSKFDSRTILDTIGAEKLLGRGDLLFIPPGSSSLMRIQGCLISDEEIESICSFIKSQKTPDYEMEIVEGRDKQEGFDVTDTAPGNEEDALYQEAKRIVLTTKIASISMLQRRLKIGFNKAARLIEEMDKEGLLGPYREGKPRKVITNRQDDEQ